MFEREVREMLAGERAEALVGIVEGAWAEMLSGKVPRRKVTRAAVMWEYMIDLADDRLFPLDGVRRFELRRIPMYVIDDRIAIRFKKHDRDGFTSNIYTRHQRALLSQNPIEGLPGEIAHLPCGYKVDPAGAELSAVIVSKPIGIRRVEWEIDLRQLAAGELQSYTEPLPIQPAAPAAELPGVRAAREEAEGGTQQS